jgi:hypothetical protein
VLSWWKYSSGSKRAHESDVADSSSVGSIARPMGRVLLKKRKREKFKKGESGNVNHG